MENYHYKILKPNEVYKEATIEKSGITATFTIADIERHEEYLNKCKKELEGQITLESAKMANIEENHPFVKDMSDQDLATAGLYFSSKSLKRQSEEKLAEISTAITEYAAEKEEIMKLPELIHAVDPIPHETESK